MNLASFLALGDILTSPESAVSQTLPRFLTLPDFPFWKNSPTFLPSIETLCLAEPHLSDSGARLLSLIWETSHSPLEALLINAILLSQPSHFKKGIPPPLSSWLKSSSGPILTSDCLKLAPFFALGDIPPSPGSVVRQRYPAFSTFRTLLSSNKRTSSS